jgi:hypothetical protein
MTSHYSKLGTVRDFGAGTEIPLSGLNDRTISPGGYKASDFRNNTFSTAYRNNTFSTTASAPHFQKRGFIGALNGWWLEIGSLALAFAVMLVTVVLLAHYNGKQLSETPRRPGLNTLVNIFSTIEASLLVFVAAESKSGS